ncbi:MAG: hypothetical protein AABX34_01570 [Nanoarchaeota archaeon]
MLRPFVGKWNEESCLEFWKEVGKRFVPATAKYRFNVCTDGNKQNTPALQTIFPAGAVNYARVKKIRRGDIVIGIVRKNVLGYTTIEEIGIRHIDGFCARLRERVSRYCRKSKTFSKKKTAFYYHLCIFQAYNNFIEPYKDKKTPCMIEGITSRFWDWDDFFKRFYPSSQ